MCIILSNITIYYWIACSFHGFLRTPADHAEAGGAAGLMERSEVAEAHRVVDLQAKVADLTVKLTRAESESKPLSASAQVQH